MSPRISVAKVLLLQFGATMTLAQFKAHFVPTITDKSVRNRVSRGDLPAMINGVFDTQQIGDWWDSLVIGSDAARVESSRSQPPPRPDPISPDWMREAEAAEYCRCSLGAFREMRLPAYNSGGRKVYQRKMIDQALSARQWSTGTTPRVEAPPLPGMPDLRSMRLRPFKARKKAATPGASSD